MFSTYTYGECRPYDNIMLLSFIVSSSMIGNFLVMYFNNKTGDSTRLFSLTTILLLWSQLMNIVVFILSWCFGSFFGNIRMKVKGYTNTPIFVSQPGREYVYSGKLLHKIFVNIGLHQCPEMVSGNADDVLGLRDKRPKSRRELKHWLFLPEVLRSYNISDLISDWESEIKDIVECKVCRLSEYFGVMERESCPPLCSLSPFTELNAVSMAVLTETYYCVPFDFGTDLYYESNKHFLMGDYSLKAAITFVDSLICLLKLLKIVYIDDWELTDIPDIFNMYRSFAYYILHHHVHELLKCTRTSESSTGPLSTTSESSAIKTNYSQLNEVKRVSLDLENQNNNLRQLQRSSSSTSATLEDIRVKIYAEKNIQSNSKNVKSKDRSNRKVLSNRPRILDNTCWRMIHWRSDLDNTLNLLLDSIVLIPLKNTISNVHKVDVNMDRIGTVYLYAQNLLLNCTRSHNLCKACLDSGNFDRSPWRFPQPLIVEEHVLMQDLLRNFQAFVLLSEIMIEKAINKVSDDIFLNLINLVLTENSCEPPISRLESLTVHVTNKTIVEAKEELSAEMYYPVSAFSRMAFFVTVAKHLDDRKYLIGTCPALAGFLEVSQTDLNNSENLIVSLVEIIVYEMSRFETSRKHIWYYSNKSLVGNLCEKVLTRTKDDISALTLYFVTSIINHEKVSHELNLNKMYVSSRLDRFSELQQIHIRNCVMEHLQRWGLSNLCNKQTSYLMKIFLQEKFSQTTPTKVEMKIDIESDAATDSEKEGTFFEVKEKELDLPRGYLSILSLLTYRVWLQEDHSKIADEFLWQFYLAYYRNSEKLFPHWTKTIIQLLLISLIMAGFISLPFCENMLKGAAMKEWALLLILSLVLNAVVLESLKVAAICLYKQRCQKSK